jgi:hypothetical protein
MASTKTTSQRCQQSAQILPWSSKWSVFEYVRENALWEEQVEVEQLGSDDSESEHSRAEDVCEDRKTSEDKFGKFLLSLVKYVACIFCYLKMFTMLLDYCLILILNHC